MSVFLSWSLVEGFQSPSLVLHHFPPSINAIALDLQCIYFTSIQQIRLSFSLTFIYHKIEIHIPRKPSVFVQSVPGNTLLYASTRLPSHPRQDRDLNTNISQAINIHFLYFLFAFRQENFIQ